MREVMCVIHVVSRGGFLNTLKQVSKLMLYVCLATAATYIHIQWVYVYITIVLCLYD